ncbi:MAG: hypothetical protein COA47_06390 [Robiginitomaculum sp.]|nr:MAG: hypothetical protein COA47_06390 [Robiginitomaculum sp.]
MTLSPNTQQKLQVIFNALPPTISSRLKMAFEHGRMGQDKSLPFELLSQMLSPSISEQDLDDWFFPVSELAVKTASRSDQIPYKLLLDIWTMMGDELVVEGVGAGSSKGSFPSEGKKKIALKLQEMWEAEGGRARLNARFGADSASKIPLIFRVLSFASEIGEMMESWPEEIKDLDDQHLIPVRDLNELLAETDPDITPYLLFLLKSRLRHPQQILRAIERISRQNSDQMIVNTDMNDVVETLLDEAENLLSGLDQEISSVSEITAIDASLCRLTNIITGSTDEFDINPDSSWGKRHYSLISKSVQFWTNRLQDAWDAIDLAMPRANTKKFLGGSLSGPELSSHISECILETAEIDAALLKMSYTYSSKIGYSAIRDKIDGLMEERLRVTENCLIDLLADPGEMDSETLQNHFSALVKIKNQYHGDEAASVLNRRGIAACAA